MIETNLRIQSVVYQSGIVEGLRDVHKIERQTVSGDDLTEEIRDLLLLSGAAYLDGTYGDPFTASPMQYDRIAVRTQNDTAVTVCYNRAYTLFRKDSDNLRAIHEALERLNRMTGYKSGPVSPSRKKGKGRRRTGNPHTRRLREKAKCPGRGHPVALVDYYGPDDRKATDVTVGIWKAPDEEGCDIYTRQTEEGDIRYHEGVNLNILDMVDYFGVQTVILSKGIVGCPHEADEDFVEGQTCPECAFWTAGKRGRSAIDQVLILEE